MLSNEKMKQVSDATQAIGFATGVLEMLAIVAEGLNKSQLEGIQEAIEGLSRVSPLALAQARNEENKDDG
jgi:hypothetical protein